MSLKEFPYSLTPNRLKTFIEQMPRMGVPSKVTTRTLPAMGFKSTNDRSIVSILRSLDLISDNGVPTPHWQEMRVESTMKHSLAHRLRHAYADLFQLFPNAHERSEAEIRDYIRAHNKAGERAVSAMVSTFRILCSLADFTQVAEPNGRMQSITPATGVQILNKQQGAKSNAHAENGILNDPLIAMPKVTVNLQIQLPETADYEYIDNVFESLARHILGRETPTEGIEFLDEESVEDVGDSPSVSENEEETRQEGVDEVG